MLDSAKDLVLPPTPPSSSSRSPSLPPTPVENASAATSSSSSSSAHEQEQQRSQEWERSPPLDEQTRAARVPLSECEQRAVEAVEAYHAEVHRELLGRALHDSSQEVAAAVDAMIDAHERDAAAANSSSDRLRGELAQATQTVAQLSERLAAVRSIQAEWQGGPSAAAGRAADFVAGTQSSSNSSSEHEFEEEEAKDRHAQRSRQAVEAAAGGSEEVALADPRRHDGVLVSASPHAVAALLADFKHAESALALLAEERDGWQRRAEELTQLLSTVTRENAEYRRELAVAKASTVSVATYQDAAQERDRAVLELGTLRLHTQKLAEQLDAEALLRAIDSNGHDDAEEEGEEEEASGGPAAGQQASQPGAALSSTEALDGANEPHHPGMWAMAVREVEEQAALAATHAATQERLLEVEARVAALTTEKASMESALTALRTEDALLRMDAQSLVYRNGVLSQQLASLLVKVENLRRGVRVYDSDGHSSSGRSNDSHSSHSSASAEGNAVGAAQPSSNRRVERVDAIRGAAAAASLSLYREHGGGDVTLPPTGRMPPSAVSSVSLLSSGVLDLVRSSSTPAVASDRPLPTSARSTLPPLEAEVGVRRRLGVYAGSSSTTSSALATRSRSRRVAMRGFGGAEVEVALPLEPRLPVCDQLSGVALGQPSTHILLDPARGAVTRYHSPAELTLIGSSSASRTAAYAGERVSASREVGEDVSRHLLDMLDTVDADDKLERFSTNSVAELVLRNQELVAQLYTTTQRAALAEENVRALQSSGRAASHGTATRRDDLDRESESYTLLSSGSGDAHVGLGRAGGAPVHASTQRAAAHLVHASSSSGTATAAAAATATTTAANEEGCTDDDNDTGTVVMTASAPATQPRCDDAAATAAAAVQQAPWVAAVAGAEQLTNGVRAAATKLIASVVGHHDMSKTRLDQSLTASLLPFVRRSRAWRPSSVEGAEDPLLEPSDAAAGGLVGSLISLCTSQAVTLAQQALTAAETARTAQADAHRTGWTAAEELLTRLTRESRDAIVAHLATLVSTSSEQASPPPLPSSSAPAGLAAVDKETSEDTLLRVTALLRTAAEKEATVEQVHAAAQSRQRAFLQAKERKAAKLAARTERAAAALASMIASVHQQRHTPLTASSDVAMAPSVSLERAGAETPDHVPLHAAAGMRASSPTPPPATAAESRTPVMTAMAALGSPAGPFVGLPISATAAAAVEAYLPSLPGVRGEGTGVTISAENPFLVVTDASDADDEDDEALFAELKTRLALAQAQSDRLARELQDEKAAHVELYERMWKLEVERDAAAEEQQKAIAMANERFTKEEYESVIADLDEAKNSIGDRDAQLAHAQRENSDLLTRLDLMKEQLDSHQQRHDQAAAAQREELARLGRDLEDQGRRYNKLYAHDKQMAEEVCVLRQDAQSAAFAAAQDATQIHGLSEQLAHVKQQLLTDDSTQVLLQELYPGNTVLAAHSAMLKSLRGERAELATKLHETTLALHDTERALAERTAELRQAVQRRQAAEVQLQGWMLRRQQPAATTAAEGKRKRRRVDAAPNEPQSHSQPATGAAPRSDPTTPTGPAADGDHKPRSEESGEDDDGRSNVDDAATAVTVQTLTAVRHRHRLLVEELQETIRSQEREVQQLRHSEAAWKEREFELRRQLDLLGRDPISETARKYGLRACDSYDAQIRELSERVDAVQDNADIIEREKSLATRALAEAQERLQAEEEKVAEKQAIIIAQAADLAARDAMAQQRDSEVNTLREKVASEEAAHALQQEELHRLSAERQSQQQQLQSCQEALQRCEADREKFLSDNRALIGKVEDLQRDLLKSDADKRAANAALSQGMKALSSSAAAAAAAARGRVSGARGSQQPPSSSAAAAARRFMRGATSFAPSSSSTHSTHSGVSHQASSVSAPSHGSLPTSFLSLSGHTASPSSGGSVFRAADGADGGNVTRVDGARPGSQNNSTVLGSAFPRSAFGSTSS